MELMERGGYFARPRNSCQGKRRFPFVRRGRFSERVENWSLVPKRYQRIDLSSTAGWDRTRCKTDNQNAHHDRGKSPRISNRYTPDLACEEVREAQASKYAYQNACHDHA
jgi:hypothetical protein